MIVIRKTIYGRDVAGGGNDVVVADCPIPKGGKLLSVQGSLHMIGEESHDVAHIVGYGFSGHLVEIVDPESTITVDALWDDIIVKAVDPTVVAATNLLDLDWITNDPAAEIQPGELDMNDLLGFGNMGDKEIFPARLELVSWAKSRQGGWVAGSPDSFLPSDYKTFSSKRTLVADKPSMALLGVTSPAWEDVRIPGNQATFGTAAEWYQLMNMENTLDKMGEMQAGLTEAGAESPYVNASSLIAELVAPQVVDEATTASKFEDMNWEVVCSVIWVIELPDRSLPHVLDGR